MIYPARLTIRERSAHSPSTASVSDRPLVTTEGKRPGKRAFRCWHEGDGYDRNIASNS